MKENCLLLFVKFPEKGKIKTRLSSQIGEDIAAELYENFVLDLLATIRKINVDLYINFYPEDAQEKFVQWLGARYTYLPQKGENLGERMKNAFLQGFEKGYRAIIVIGSDCPDLPSEVLEYAFLFPEGNEAVIGPTHDGGYYLVGFKRTAFLPEIFDGIEWGTERVFNDTMGIFDRKKYSVYVLPKCRDIDTIEDLKEYFKSNTETAFRKSRSVLYIHSRGIFEK